MYSTCLFCLKDLNANTVVEHFPIGRRLAFDGEKGRLWVVCRKCDRWNLTPLEERWEAIEECERLFESTRLRMSTEHIGLARLKEGLELVRVGRPKRPEFAAWRYGDQFGRRRRSNIIKAGLGLGAVGAVLAGGAVAGASIASFAYFFVQMAQNVVHGSPEKVVARIHTDGDTLKVRRKQLPHVQLYTASTGWSLGVPGAKKKIAQLDGDAAVRAAGMLLPHINRFGGKKDEVQRAVRLLEGQKDPVHYFAEAARYATSKRNSLSRLPHSARLALEMASHEDTERRVMEGELVVLENAWREAEEVAAIADNLLVPRSVEEFIQRSRRQ